MNTRPIVLALAAACLLILPAVLADDIPIQVGGKDVNVDQPAGNTPTCGLTVCTSGSTLGPLSTPSTPPFCTPVVCNSGAPIQLIGPVAIPSLCSVINQNVGPNCGSQATPAVLLDVQWTDVIVTLTHVGETQNVGPFTVFGVTLCPTPGCPEPAQPGATGSGTITVTWGVQGNTQTYSYPIAFP